MNQRLIKQTSEGIYLVHPKGLSESLYSRTYSVIFNRPQCLIPVSINKKSEEYYEITGLPAGTTGGPSHQDDQEGREANAPYYGFNIGNTVSIKYT